MNPARLAQDVGAMEHQLQEAISTGRDPLPYVRQLYCYLGLYLGYTKLEDNSTLDNGMETVILIKEKP